MRKSAQSSAKQPVSAGYVNASYRVAVVEDELPSQRLKRPAPPSQQWRPGLDVTPSYRVAIDGAIAEAGQHLPPQPPPAYASDQRNGRAADTKRATATAAAASAGCACLPCCLLVVCCVLLAVCLVLLAVTITFGVLYSEAAGRQSSIGGPDVRASLEDSTQNDTTNETMELAPGQTRVSSETLGNLNGRPVTKFTLRNAHDVEVDVVSHGARVNAVRVPSKVGFLDILEGVDDTNVSNFAGDRMGAANGPVCSFISWSFQYGGKMYSFAKPPDAEPRFYVDGGVDGFYTRNYERSYVDKLSRVHFVLSDNTPSGYPAPSGSYKVHVIYELTSENELIVSMSLSADVTVPVDMCSTLPFNLGGEGSNTLSSHNVAIFSNEPRAVDGNGIEYNIQAQPYLQFKPSHSIDPVVNYVSQLSPRYDFTYAINGPTGKRLLASISHSVTGIGVDIFSDQPAVRFTVPDRGSRISGKSNHTYTGPSAFVIQPHRYPLFDTLLRTQSDIGAFMLSSSDEYRHVTSYKFTF